MTSPAAKQRARRTYSPRQPAEHRRQQLLDAALDIIVRDGYRAVSAGSIVRELGVTRPVFYNVFASLDELLTELLDRQERRALEQLAQTITFPGRGDEAGAYLERTVRALVAMVRNDPRTWLPIFQGTVDTPDAVRTRIDRDREAVRLRFRDFAAMTIARDDRLDADVLSHALIAIGEYFGRRILDDAGAVDATKLASTLSAVFAGGS